MDKQILINYEYDQTNNVICNIEWNKRKQKNYCCSKK